jgi:predicted permease
MLRDLLQDLRHGLRMLRRGPGFAALVIATLAIGIGANTAIFSLVDAVLLRPLPVRDPARLVLLQDGFRGGGWRWDEVTDRQLDLYTYPLYRRLRDDPLFEGIAAQDSNTILAVLGGHAGADPGERPAGRAVSANFFSVLGASAVRGRTFRPDDETAPGANPVLVMSHRCWQRRFGGDPTVVGQRLVMNGTPFTVVGITAPGFAGAEIGSDTDFWVPITMAAELARESSRRSLLGPPTGPRDLRWLHLVGRLKRGVSLATAEGSVDRTLQAFLDADPALARVVRGRQPLHIALSDGSRGFTSLAARFRDQLLALMAGVGVLMLIVSLNVSHLLLARAMTRQQEMSIRTALGASRGRLARQLLTEGLLLSALASAAAVVVARWLCDGLMSLARVSALDAGIDGRALAFTSLLALGCALIIGLVPAWRTEAHGRRPVDLHAVLKADARAVIVGRGGRRSLSRVLLASQVALSLVLVVGAGLLAETLQRLRTVDKGFKAEDVLLVDLNTRSSGLDLAELKPLYDELLRRVAGLPGVRKASLSLGARVVQGGRWVEPVFLPGSTTELRVMLAVVTPEYFATMGIALVAGRRLGVEDRAGAPRVAVINEALARRFASGASPAEVLGKRFRFEDDSVLVVGIVGDIRGSGFRQPGRPMVYFPAAQARRAPDNLDVRASPGVDLSRLSDEIRRLVRAAHPQLFVVGSRPLPTQVERTLARERMLATVAATFGLTATFLVALGLFGVISQWVSQRTREIGVRMALGATTGGVRWLVFRQALTLVLVGVLVGVPAALAGARLLENLLFGVEAADTRTLIASACLLFAVTVTATYLPARRASRLDPVAALRAE